jgi:RHS repeat-associated protein
VKITNCAGCLPAIFSDFFLPSHFTIDWTPSTAILPPNGIPFCSQITDDPSHNLAAGASCVLGVSFKPTTTGVVTDSFGIDMMCDLPCQGQVFSLPLVGTGGSGPVLIFKPNPMVFPNPVPAGTISTDKEIVTVTNTGNAAATISGMPGAPGTPVTAFHLDTSTCYQGLPAPPPPPAAYPTCTMTFSFRPPAGTPAGVLTADPLATPPNPLTIYLAPNDSFAFSLSAVGTVGAAVANGPAVQLDGTSCPATGSCETLRMLATGGGTSTSPPQTVTLKNTGNAALHISNVKMNGDLTGFSKVNDTCLGQTIQAQGTCTLMFTFNASVVGPSQTTVTITDDATPTTQTITLLGGISGPAIVVKPDTNLTFSANVGKQIGTNVTLTNVGSVDVTIQNINLTANANENGFSLGDLTSCFSGALTAGSAGQSGGTCTFPVNFIPASAGSFTNSIVITTLINTTPWLPITISLHGAAVAAPAAMQLTVSRYALSSVPDPVDGATGQFYEDDLDLSLGGPLNLQFVRYYGSGLSSGGYQSSLGVNWMSNFDVSLTLNGSTAKVFLFRGKTVTFSKAGGLWTLASPTDIGYQFAAAGPGYQFMSPVSGLIYTFNSSGQLSGIADGKGNALTVTQGANGPTSISDGLGRTLTLTYTGTGLTSVQDQTGRVVSYSYTGANLTSSIDALKKTTQYTYVTAGTFAGLMTKKQLPAGNAPTTQTYDASGRVTVQTDGNGNTTQIGYDGKGGTTITHALGGVVQQSNNASGDLGQLTDPSGKSLTVTFDSAENRTGVTDKLGNVVKFTYHTPTGKIASRTDEAGNTTSYSYTARTQAGLIFYDLTGIAFPDGTSNSMSYDANGNLTSRTGADGTTGTKTYDGSGRVLKATDANKQTTGFVYNSDGSLASRVDPLGNVESYSYTTAGQPSKINDPNGGVTAFTYDADGRQLSSTDAVGAAISNRYDDNGQRVAVTNRDGGTFGFTYSPTGQMASLNDPLGNKTVYSYDAEGRIASATNAAGETISRTYDSVGHLLSLSDKQGPRVNYAYDVEGRILSQTDPAGKVTSFGYGSTGQLTSTTKPDGAKYTFAYDKLGRLLSLANPLGETQSVKRDAMGRVTQIALPGDLTSAIQFDVQGRTAAITSPNGNTWTLTNDALGRISSMADPLGNTTTRSYTGTQLTGMALPLGTLAVTRDKDGRVTRRKYSDGTTINTAYDPMGLLTSADGVTIQRDVMGHAVNVNGIALTYTAAGRLATLTYAPGKTVTYAYDNAGRLSSVGDWVGGQTTFAYDAASRLAGLTYPNGVATTYSFDGNGRLSGIAAGGLASIALIRDGDGKIVSANRNLPTTPALQGSSQQFSYNAAAQMNGEKFDAMGRALTETGRTYTWNLASQLTGFRDSVNAATLNYDGLGELSTSNASGAAETFVFNHATTFSALSIVRQGGSDLRYYVYTPDGKPLYSIEAAGQARKYYHFDEMGNATFLTGDNGSVTDTYAITPYGDVADHVGPTDNPFTWQGQYGIIQESKGLYFVRQRHYDASATRFLSPDPLTTPDPRSAEPYTYARGNPLLYVDPSGALSWAQISTYQESVRGLDNWVPNITDEMAIFADIFDPNAAIMVSLIQSHPGLNWWDLHGLADDAPTNPIPPPSNAWILSSCNKTGSCSPNLVTGLTALVLQGQGNQAEVNATAILLGNAVISNDGGSVISNDGGSVVSHDGGSVVSHDGGSLISQDGGGLISQDGGGVVSHDGGGLISQDGGGLISQDGGGLIGNSGSTLIGNSGSTLIGNSGSTLTGIGQ